MYDPESPSIFDGLFTFGRLPFSSNYNNQELASASSLNLLACSKKINEAKSFRPFFAGIFAVPDKPVYLLNLITEKLSNT